MGIELIIIAIGLVAVVATNGSLKKLFTTKFSHVWTLGFVIAGHLAILFAPIDKSQYDTIGLGILLSTYVFLFAFCIANVHKFGMLFVLAGTICNALVIGLNKGMPVTTSGGFDVVESVKYQAASNNDLLPWLGDIIPINAVSMAISVGDILFALGVVFVCVSASRKDKKVKNESVTDDMNEQVDTEVESALDEIVASIGPTTDEVPIVVIEDHHSATATIVDEHDDDLNEVVFIDLTHEEQIAMLESSNDVIEQEAVQRSEKKKYKASKRTGKKRSARRWQKTHGLNALPSKEELGYDDTSMEVVDAAD